MYYEGGKFNNILEIEQSYEKAREWYKKAAEQGNSDAQFKLANIYEEGQGVQQSFEKAVEWYEKAAILGNAEAQLKMGIMYEQGLGIEKNYVKSV